MQPEDFGILIKKALVPEERRPIPLDVGGLLDCEWVGILKYEGSTQIELVFYDTSGEPREWLFRESVADAVKDAESITDCISLKWIECNVTGIDDGEILNWQHLTHH